MYYPMPKTIVMWLLSILLVAGVVGCASGVPISYQRSSATGPLRVLTANPRYFTDGSGRAVYLTGSHYWWNLVDGGESDPPSVFDFSAYLYFLERYNHNFVRLWAMEQARWNASSTDDFYVNISPFSRPGPELALDGKPKFDVDTFNEAYFDRLRARVVAGGNRGIYVSIMLFNGWCVESFEDMNLHGNPWPGHPFHRQNNINGVDGDINDDNQGQEIHTLGTDPRLLAIRARQEAYVRKVIDTLNDLDNVLYEIGNEIVEASTDWQYHMIRYIKEFEAGKPKQHPVGMTYQGMQGKAAPHNATLFNSPADWISPGNIASAGTPPDARYQENPPVADGQKVIIVDTDHLWGIGGDSTWVWKSFTRGLNPIYMDPYEDRKSPAANYSARRAMGDTLMYANRVNLSAMAPRPELVSSSYCLAQPGLEYLIYVPSTAKPLDVLPPQREETITVDLSGSSATFRIEWFDPITGKTIVGGMVAGGSNRTFIAPFGGEAVLYLTADLLNDK